MNQQITKEEQIWNKISEIEKQIIGLKSRLHAWRTTALFCIGYIIVDVFLKLKGK